MDFRNALLTLVICFSAAAIGTRADAQHTPFQASQYPAPPVSSGVIPHGATAPVDQWNALDSLELFGGLEGSKQPQDFGVNAHFGGRLHVNWGVPLWEELGLGLQVGVGQNWTDHAVRVTSQIDGAGSRSQTFTTLGLFQRMDSGWTWGIGHDFLFEDDYDTFSLSQWRGRIGYNLTDCDEVGFAGMVPQKEDDGLWATIPVELRAIAQYHLYWRHTWEHSAQTGFWIGAADGHSRANVALGDASPSGTVVVFGSDLHLPLNDSWAIYGEANFITPADTGTVDAFLGFAYYPGGGARGFRNRRFSPVLPVANNTTFSTDLER